MFCVNVKFLKLNSRSPTKKRFSYIWEKQKLVNMTLSLLPTDFVCELLFVTSTELIAKIEKDSKNSGRISIYN